MLVGPLVRVVLHLGSRSHFPVSHTLFQRHGWKSCLDVLFVGYWWLYPRGDVQRLPDVVDWVLGFAVRAERRCGGDIGLLVSGTLVSRNCVLNKLFC